MLGHRDVSTTMSHAHVLNSGPAAERKIANRKNIDVRYYSVAFRLGEAP